MESTPRGVPPLQLAELRRRVLLRSSFGDPIPSGKYFVCQFLYFISVMECFNKDISGTYTSVPDPQFSVHLGIAEMENIRGKNAPSSSKY